MCALLVILFSSSFSISGSFEFSSDLFFFVFFLSALIGRFGMLIVPDGVMNGAFSLPIIQGVDSVSECKRLFAVF